ncbi:glycosyltransferase family 2 protein [Turicibacter sanguinis]|uniref:glycosyltransferase family 2 protein n=1 Tax=Turicibacter sanguinis TaxID=154288 RepID=UPI0032EE1F8E
MSILFSVLVPVYNADKYIEECIESVLSQEYKKFELILVDDGSLDKSYKICRDYSKKDSRVKVYTQKNQGPLIARNTAISKARGEYLLFLDADDYWDKGLLKTVYDTIEECKCDMVMYKFQRVCNKQVKPSKRLFENGIIIHKEDIYIKLITGTDLNSLAIKAIKKELITPLNEDRFKKIKNGEDLLQSLPIIYHAKRIAYIDKALYNYRTNTESITHSFDINQINTSRIVRGEVLNYLIKANLDTSENLSLFYTFYIKSILFYIHRLIISDYNLTDKLNKLIEVENMDLYREGQKYFRCKKLNIEYQIRYLLFKKKLIIILFGFEATVNIIKNIRKKISEWRNKYEK